MNDSKKTKDLVTIEKWAKKRGGLPSIVKDTEDLLRIKFDETEKDLNEITWAEFFKTFQEKDLTFLYEESPESRFHKFIEE